MPSIFRAKKKKKAVGDWVKRGERKREGRVRLKPILEEGRIVPVPERKNQEAGKIRKRRLSHLLLIQKKGKERKIGLPPNACTPRKNVRKEFGQGEKKERLLLFVGGERGGEKRPTTEGGEGKKKREEPSPHNSLLPGRREETKFVRRGGGD